MIIDSPIISGSYAATGSLNQVGDVTITGSLRVTGAIIGAVTGSVDSASFASTASFVSPNTQINSASFAITASYVSPNTQINTASFAITSSYASTVDFNNTVATSSYSLTASYVSPTIPIDTASFAITASYVSPNTQINSASFATTASYALNADLLDGLDSSAFTSVSSFNSYTSSASSRLSSIESTTASLNTASGSAITRLSALEVTSGSNITRISALELASGSAITRLNSIESTTGSLNSYTASNDATVTSVAAAAVSAVAGVNALASKTGSYTLTSSFNSYTASNDTTMSCVSSTATSAIAGVGALASKTGSYATTGSNTFVEGQYISSSYNPTGFTTTASLYTDGGLRVGRDAYISGTLYLNNVTVYGTQSISYISSSQLNIGTNIISVNTDTPSVRFGGLAVYDSGSTGLTGSILWDSQNNHWVYSNPSGSTYSGGMFISGPRTSTLGSETGTTSCMLLAGQGGDHLTSSMIYHSSTATCIPTAILGGSTACFASSVTSLSNNFITTTNAYTTQGTVSYNDARGLILRAKTATVYDYAVYSADESSIIVNPTGTTNVSFPNGNIGVGTISPYNKLTIEGLNSRIDLNDGGGSSRKALLIEPLGYGSNSYARIESYNYGTDTGGNLVINTTGGNVGIGTASPANKLDVNGTLSTSLIVPYGTTYKTSNFLDFYPGNDNVLFFHAGTSWGDPLIAVNGTTAGSVLTNSLAQQLVIRGDGANGIGFSNGSSINMIIKGSCVGVRTTSPRSTLHVQQATNDGVPAVGCARDGLIISSNNGNYGLNIGVDPTGPTWIESMRFDDGATAYNLLLQAAGRCSVLIGTGTALAGCRQQLVIGGNNFGSLIALGNNGNGNKFVIESDSSENVLINNKSNTPMIFYTNNSRRMDITGDGYVGIGCTSPGAQLVVYGACNGDTTLHVQNGSVSGKITFSNNTANAIYGGGWWGYMGYSSATYHNFAQCVVAPSFAVPSSGCIFYCTGAGYNGIIKLWDSTNGNMVFQNASGGTGDMIFLPQGKVGIGTTSPNEKLDVNGTIQVRGESVGYATTQCVTQLDFYAGAARLLSFGGNSTTCGGFRFYSAGQNNNGGSDVVTISGGGVACFRGTICAPRLHINTPDGCGLTLQYGANSGYAGISTDAANNLIFKAYIGTEYMRIKCDGNVGINTTNPSYKLDVVGNSRVCGSLLVSSTTDGYTNGRLHVSRYGNSSGGSILMGVENDSTGKWSYLVSTQYNSSTYPQGFSVIGGYTDSTANKIVIGGSIYEANPATEIQFWTHTSVSHNLGGSQKMTITCTGVVNFACTICVNGGNIFLPGSISGRTAQIEFGNSGTADILGMPNLTTTFYLKYGCNSILFSNDSGGEILRMCNNKTIAVNGPIVPTSNGTIDLGTSSLRWCTVYTSDLSLSNGIGDYTMVEGENDLFLYNNKQCKVYKFMLQEVCPEIAPAKRST